VSTVSAGCVEFGNETPCSISRFRSGAPSLLDIACVFKAKNVLALLGVIVGTPAPGEVQTPSSRPAAHNASTEATSAVGTVNNPSRVYSPTLAVTP